jgi:hypothetical protein
MSLMLTLIDHYGVATTEIIKTLRKVVQVCAKFHAPLFSSTGARGRLKQKLLPATFAGCAEFPPLP